ncbi:MAG: DUF1330 domain-containing protein [Erythrobacter sp.]
MDQKLDPDETQLAKLMSLPAETPLAVLNLFEFNEVANYQPGDREYATSAADISGQEAFQRYSEVAGKFLEDLGGRIAMNAPFEQVLIGTQPANWHVAAIMYFPSRGAFLQMLSDANFQHASRHRKAALKNHLMIHLNGETFKK